MDANVEKIFQTVIEASLISRYYVVNSPYLKFLLGKIKGSYYVASSILVRAGG